MNSFNLEEVKSLIAFAKEELCDAQYLFDNGRYRNTFTGSYFAMFHSARALLLTEEYVGIKHDLTLKQFSCLIVDKKDFDKEIFSYYKLTKEKICSYDFTVDFDKSEAQNYLNKAGVFINECEKYLQDNYDIN